MTIGTESISGLLHLKTANTTLRLRFTLIAESINSHTLDRVKVNFSMNQLNTSFKINRPVQGSGNPPPWTGYN
ncbi:hypothetical protein NIES3585_36490 [Nodularia sp. NIES-3585]|nr:hypothetical protein NIES3585_36490 [Nodularia sp. NIES-3585]